MALEKVNFAVEDISLIEDISRSQFVKVRLKAFASGDNAHHLYVSEETLKRTAHTIYNKPLVWEYNPLSDDIGNHSRGQVPCGFVPEVDNEISFEENEDGRLFMCVNALIWKKYSNGILKFFARDSMKKPVSVEMMVIEARENENGDKEILDLVYAGVTILGTFVAPAVPQAEAEIIEFSKAKSAYELKFQKSNTNFPQQGDNQEITLKNSTHPQFDYEYAKNLKENHPEIWKLGGNIRGNEAFELWGKARNGSKTQAVLSWIKEREAWGARHKKDKNIAGVVANVKWGTIVSRGEAYMKELIDKEIKKKSDGDEEKFAYADSDTKNFEGDSAKMKKEMLAKMSSLVDAEKFGVFAADDKFIYAYAKEDKKFVAIPYAKAEPVEGEEEKFEAQVDMAKKLKMGCKYAVMEDDENEEDEDDDDTEILMGAMIESGMFNFSVTVNEKRDALESKLRNIFAKDCWFYIADFDDEYVYVRIEGELFRFSYDQSTFEVDANSKLQVRVSTTYVEFSSDVNAQVADQEKQIEKEGEEQKEGTEDANINEAKMTEMEADMAKMAEELESLRKFQSDVLMAQEKAQMETVMAEIADSVNEDKAEEIKSKREEFADFDAFRNFALAEAYAVAKKLPKNDKKYVFAALPHNEDDNKPKTKWDKF